MLQGHKHKGEVGGFNIVKHSRHSAIHNVSHAGIKITPRSSDEYSNPKKAFDGLCRNHFHLRQEFGSATIADDMLVG